MVEMCEKELSQRAGLLCMIYDMILLLLRINEQSVSVCVLQFLR